MCRFQAEYVTGKTVHNTFYALGKNTYMFALWGFLKRNHNNFIVSSFADRRSVMWFVANVHKPMYRIYSWWYRWARWRWPVKITFSSKVVACANQNTPPDRRRNQILYLRSIRKITARCNSTRYNLRKPYQNKHNLEQAALL